LFNPRLYDYTAEIERMVARGTFADQVEMIRWLYLTDALQKQSPESISQLLWATLERAMDLPREMSQQDHQLLFFAILTYCTISDLSSAEGSELLAELGAVAMQHWAAERPTA
jgi:hypothetical protein